MILQERKGKKERKKKKKEKRDTNSLSACEIGKQLFWGIMNP